MTKSVNPDYIIFDFDRTLTYLYKDKSLLNTLKTQVLDCYSKYFKVPTSIIESDTSAYFSWHKLSEYTKTLFESSKVRETNIEADKVVADFELSCYKKTGLLEKNSW